MRAFYKRSVMHKAIFKRLRLVNSILARGMAHHVYRTYVSQIERFIGNPSIYVIIKLTAVLGVDICELLKPANFSE
jgi:transcriptional regulator with XRE-family HTH domain